MRVVLLLVGILALLYYFSPSSVPSPSGGVPPPPPLPQMPASGDEDEPEEPATYVPYIDVTVRDPTGDAVVGCTVIAMTSTGVSITGRTSTGGVARLVYPNAVPLDFLGVLVRLVATKEVDTGLSAPETLRPANIPDNGTLPAFGRDTNFTLTVVGSKTSRDRWVRIQNALAVAHSTGEVQHVEFTYSYVRSGTVSDEGRATVSLGDYGGGRHHVTPDQFKSQIREGLRIWGRFLSYALPNVMVSFRELGEETPAARNVAMSVTGPSHTTSDAVYNIGDVRIGMYHMDTSSVGDGVLAYAYGPDYSWNQTSLTEGTLGGDVLFNADEDWKLDSDAHSADEFSILYVFVHEFGHVLGLLHDGVQDSFMFPAAQDTHAYSARRFTLDPDESSARDLSPCEFYAVRELYNISPLSFRLTDQEMDEFRRASLTTG